MKHIVFFAAFVIPILVNGQADTAISRLLDDPNGAFIDSSILYRIDTNRTNRAIQNDGVWRIRDKNSILLSITSFSNGRLNGHSLEFFPNGKIATSAFYYLDTLHGPFVNFWSNGNLQSIKFYNRGKLTGIVRSYDIDGSLQTVFEVRDNKKEGLEVGLYPNGKIRYITHFSLDKEVGQRIKY